MNLVLILVNILEAVSFILIVIAIILTKKANKEAERIIEDYKKENICLYKENKSLRNENEDLKDCIKEFEKLSKEKHFNSAENLQNKMKSILNDYHISSICK